MLNRHANPKPLDQQQAKAAAKRQNELTKPLGALGRLETVAVRLAAMQGRVCPAIDRVHISIFAADHGVACEAVSAYPQAVTVEMVRNFLRGGAAINVLAQQLDAHLEVIDVGLVTPIKECEGLRLEAVAAGTKNMCEAAAMSAGQCKAALDSGCAAVERAYELQTDVFIGGEMGIANTTAASALACVLLRQSAVNLAGAGTGLDEVGINHKVTVIEASLQRHQASTLDDPFEILCCFGGFEIAALTGAYLRAAQLGLPILVDGFISSVAALLAIRMQPKVHDWLILSHHSAEKGHTLVIEALELKPLLELNMRLGEGSGAALAVPLLRQACALHAQMATFAEADVSPKTP